MMNVARFDTICQIWVAQLEGLDGYVRVVNDSHATWKLGDRSGVQLVAVVPSYKRSGNSATPDAGQSVLIWVVEKGVPDHTDGEELAQYTRTEEIVKALEKLILEQQEDGCSDWWHLEVDSIVREPEQNIFGGWNGWFMAFDF